VPPHHVASAYAYDPATGGLAHSRPWAENTIQLRHWSVVKKTPVLAGQERMASRWSGGVFRLPVQHGARKL